jgi:hypothetical protein
VYAHVRESRFHETARAWLDERLNGTPPVGIPWPSALAFMRLVSNPRVVEAPIPLPRAWAQVESWLTCRPVWIPEPTQEHRRILGRLLSGQPLGANLVPDAHLAALAIEHGLILCSTDGDFARFGGLRWENPLSA